MTQSEMYTGRTGIGHRNRENMSQRCSDGKIKIIKKRCNKCNNNKMIKYTNMMSPYQGMTKCTKCQTMTK